MRGQPTLAGRHAERVALLDVVRGRSRGLGGVVVTGPAGIGKSTLLDTVAADARAIGVLVLTGWCLPLSASLPLLPVVEILSAMANGDDPELLDTLLADAPGYVRTELGRVTGAVVVSDGDGGSAAWQSARVFEAVRWTFDALALTRTAAIVVEDVHWADPMTLDLLEYLLAPRASRTPPIVMSLRTDDRPRPLVEAWMHRQARNRRTERMPLAPMTLGETTEQVRALADGEPDPSWVATLHRRTNGNPFFVEQLVAHEREAASAQERAVVPPALTDLVVARVEDLPPSARAVAYALAVAARPLDEAELVTVGALALEHVRVGLARLRRQQLVRTSTAGQASLVHAVIGEALAEALVPGARHDVHRRVAEALMRRDDGGHDAEIAEHLAATGDLRAELPFRVRAARHAASVNAVVETERHWSAALALARRIGTDRLPTGISLHELYVRTTDALRTLGRDDEVRVVAQEAFDLLSPYTESAAELAELHSELGRTLAITDLAAGLPHLERAAELYRQTPGAVGILDVVETLEALARHAGEFGDARRYAQQGLSLAGDLGVRIHWVYFLGLAAWHAMAARDDRTALDMFDRLTASLTPDDPPESRLRAAVQHSDCLVKLGRCERAVTVADDGARQAVSDGLADSFHACLARANHYEAAAELGRPQLAAEMIDAATDDSEIGTHNRAVHVSRADLDLRRGRLDDARDRWTAMEGIEVSSLSFRVEDTARHADLLLWTRHPDDARDLALAVLVEAAPTDEAASVGPLLVLAARATADVVEAQHTTHCGPGAPAPQRDDPAAALIQLHRTLSVDPLGPHALARRGTADRAEWTAEIARARRIDDPAVWQAAADEWAVLRRRHREAYARWRQAEAILRRRGGRAEAERVLRTAFASADGHAPLRGEIMRLAGRARIDLTDAEPAADVHTPDTPSRSGLTGRELAVLRLVALGRTNAEIGRELFISVKTASVHVSNILRKLDVSSRTHPATVAQRAGLLDDVRES